MVILKDRFFRYLFYGGLLDKPGAERPPDPPILEVKISEGDVSGISESTIPHLIDEAYKFPPGFAMLKQQQIRMWQTLCLKDKQ